MNEEKPERTDFEDNPNSASMFLAYCEQPSVVAAKCIKKEHEGKAVVVRTVFEALPQPSTSTPTNPFFPPSLCLLLVPHPSHQLQ
jgi:hypothetical protein